MIEPEETTNAIVPAETNAERLFHALVRALVGQGVFEEEAPVILRALIEVLNEPADILGSILESVRGELTEGTSGVEILYLNAGIKTSMQGSSKSGSSGRSSRTCSSGSTTRRSHLRPAD